MPSGGASSKSVQGDATRNANFDDGLKRCRAAWRSKAKPDGHGNTVQCQPSAGVMSGRRAPIHLCATHDRWPFFESKIGAGDDGKAFAKVAEEMEQQLTGGLGEGQLAEIIEDGPVDGPVKAGLERGRCRSAHAA
jgi:hypothetical protein